MEAGGERGIVRIIARRADHAVIAIRAVGAHSELAGEFATLLKMGALLEDVTGIIHAYLTQGEAVHESALAALVHALHV